MAYREKAPTTLRIWHFAIARRKEGAALARGCHLRSAWRSCTLTGCDLCHGGRRVHREGQGDKPCHKGRGLTAQARDMFHTHASTGDTLLIPT